MATEKRLIDATPIIDECKECSTIEWNKSVYTTWAEAEEDFMQRLLDAPVVDAVEVVHGRWEQDGIYNRCSVCSKLTMMPHLNGLARFNYCPYCGAKMDGDGNE